MAVKLSNYDAECLLKRIESQYEALAKLDHYTAIASFRREVEVAELERLVLLLRRATGEGKPEPWVDLPVTSVK
jgi:hypothetical protein